MKGFMQFGPKFQCYGLQTLHAAFIHEGAGFRLVLGRLRPTSEASEADSWYLLFGVSKNHRRKRFLGSRHYSKVAQRPWFRGTGWPQIRPPRPTEAKNAKNRDFSRFQGWSLLHTLTPLLETVWGRDLGLTSEAVGDQDLKYDLRGCLRSKSSIN